MLGQVLEGMQPKGYVTRIQGGRVERWRHNLYDGWKVNKVELAILAELLLRGPQTEGELRGRASRMEEINDLDALRGYCKPLAERKLVAYLTPEGRRGTMLTHGFHAADELERLRARHFAAADEPAGDGGAGRAAPHRPAEDSGPLQARLDEAMVEIAGLKATVADLQTQVAALSESIRGIKEGLGIA